MKTGLIILLCVVALLSIVILYDVVAKKMSVKEAITSHLIGLFSNKVLYRILSFIISALILYLLYTLIFK